MGIPTPRASSEAHRGLLLSEPVAFDSPIASIHGTAWLRAPAAGRPLIVDLHGGGLDNRYFLGEFSLPVAAAWSAWTWSCSTALAYARDGCTAARATS